LHLIWGVSLRLSSHSMPSRLISLLGDKIGLLPAYNEGDRRIANVDNPQCEKIHPPSLEEKEFHSLNNTLTPPLDIIPSVDPAHTRGRFALTPDTFDSGPLVMSSSTASRLRNNSICEGETEV